MLLRRTFVAGETSKTVNVTVNGDGITETDESLELVLGTVTNAGLGTSRAIGFSSGAVLAEGRLSPHVQNRWRSKSQNSTVSPSSMTVRNPIVQFIQTQLRPNDLVAVMYPLTPIGDLLVEAPIPNATGEDGIATPTMLPDG